MSVSPCNQERTWQRIVSGNNAPPLSTLSLASQSPIAVLCLSSQEQRGLTMSDNSSAEANSARPLTDWRGAPLRGATAHERCSLTAQPEGKRLRPRPKQSTDSTAPPADLGPSHLTCTALRSLGAYTYCTVQCNGGPTHLTSVFSLTTFPSRGLPPRPRPPLAPTGE